MIGPVQNANPHHDERGRFAAADAQSTPPDVEAMLEKHRGGPVSLARPMIFMGGDTSLHQKEIGDYLEKHGQEFEAAPLPDGVARRDPGQCYLNATGLILAHQELDYAEGIAYASNLPKEMGFLHAWGVTKDGKVVDPTWDNPEKARYFGVRYDRAKYLSHIMKTEVYGVLGGKDKAARKVMERGGL
jgi:hypothetical protein